MGKDSAVIENESSNDKTIAPEGNMIATEQPLEIVPSVQEVGDSNPAGVVPCKPSQQKMSEGQRELPSYWLHLAIFVTKHAKAVVAVTLAITAPFIWQYAIMVTTFRMAFI